MNIGLLSILSSAPVIPSGKSDEQSDASVLDSQPFSDVMAVQTGVSDSDTDHQLVGEFIDQAPAVLLYPQEAAVDQMVLQYPAMMPVETEELLVIDASEIVPTLVTILEPEVANDELVIAYQTPIGPYDDHILEYAGDVELLPVTPVDGPFEVVQVDSEEILPPVPVYVSIDEDDEQVDVFVDAEVFADIIEKADETVATLEDIIEQDAAETNIVPVYAGPILVAATTMQAGVDSTVAVGGAATTQAVLPQQSTDGLAHRSVHSEHALPTSPATPENNVNDKELEAVIQRVLSRAGDARPNVPVTNNQVPTPNAEIVSAATSAINLTGDTGIDVLPEANLQIGTSSSTSTQSTHQGTDRFAHLTMLRAEQFMDADQSNPSEQVRVTIKQAFRAGLDRVIIQLHPEELGRVEVRIDVNELGRNQFVFTADSRDTLEALQRDARILERSLQEGGLEANAQDMEFNLNERDEASEEDGNRMRNDQRDAYSEAVEEEQEPELYLDPLTGYYTITLNDGLDIKV